MSRMLIFLILGVLLVLLGVMGFVVNPRPKGPPTAEEVAQKKEIQQKAQDQEMKQRKEQMSMMIKAQQMLEKKRKEEAKNPPKGGVKTHAEASAPAPAPTMDITSDWFHKHPDGEKGLTKLDELSKAQAKADQEADNARRQMFTGGGVGPAHDGRTHLPVGTSGGTTMIK